MRAFTPLFASFVLLVMLPCPAEEGDGNRSFVGITRAGTPIPCLFEAGDLDPMIQTPRVLLLGGLDGSIESVEAVKQTAAAFQISFSGQSSVAISQVPNIRPNTAAGAAVVPMTFPPSGNAYNQPENDVAHYLWRWLGMHAPDAVIVVAKEGDPSALSLAGALAKAAPAGIGTIPCNVVTPEKAASALTETAKFLKPSPARQEIQRRLARSAIEVATELAQVYGHNLDPVAYIPALAIVGRLRLGELVGDSTIRLDAERICGPYKTQEKESMPAKGNGSTLSGHLVFSELARRTGDAGWTALARKAADYGFDDQGQPKAFMPFHSEMSDSVFMGCAILAEVGALSQEQKYFAQCLQHLRFMEKLCLRPDGLYRHSPLDESAWGRGNGFPALGLALSLTCLQQGSVEHEAFLQSYRQHLKALRQHQDPTGAWHQVIDHPESYREFTSTCMITFAIVRGLRQGWLDASEWQPVVDRAWMAIKSRVGPKGELVDVCTGTGKMKSLREYLDRTAILGHDERGGAMALMIATEMAFWEREKAAR